MGRQRRAVEAARAPRPSGVSRDRLARRVRSEVADVRVRLEEAVLRSDALLASGQPERAAAVLDEQHALLAELQDTLSSAVAGASVEAEAEAVLRSAPDGSEIFGRTEPQPELVGAGSGPRGLRAAASALASAVAALALLIMATPTPAPGALSASAAADGTRADAVREPTDVRPSGGSSTVPDPDRAVGPNERQVRRLFAAPAVAPRDDRRPTLDVGLGLADLQALVDHFVATVVRAAGELSPGPAAAVIDSLDVRRPRPLRILDAVPSLRRPATLEPAVTSEPPAAPTDTATDTPSEPAPSETAESDEEDPTLPLPDDEGSTTEPGVPPLE